MKNTIFKKLGAGLAGAAVALTLIAAPGAAIAKTNDQLEADGVMRLGGQNRYDTAARIALHYYGDKPGGQVLIASGQDFPDALAASALAGYTKLPVLLTTKDKLASETNKALLELNPSSVMLIGGPGAISMHTQAQVEQIVGAKNVGRWMGDNRFETAAELAQWLVENADESPNTVFIASGMDFPDALAASGVAAQNNGVILLTMQGTLPDATWATLNMMKPEKIYVVGGPGVISEQIVQQLKSTDANYDVERVSGQNRFSTAEELADYFYDWDSTRLAVVSNGLNFADALVGASIAGAESGPVLLTETNRLPNETIRPIRDLEPLSILVTGGEGVISEQVLGDVIDTLFGGGVG